MVSETEERTLSATLEQTSKDLIEDFTKVLLKGRVIEIVLWYDHYSPPGHERWHEIETFEKSDTNTALAIATGIRTGEIGQWLRLSQCYFRDNVVANEICIFKPCIVKLADVGRIRIRLDYKDLADLIVQKIVKKNQKQNQKRKNIGNV